MGKRRKLEDAKECQGTEAHLMRVLQEVLLLSVVPKTAQKLLHCLLILPVSVMTASCETLNLL